MTEVQAAIGRVQLRKLTDWVEIRRRNAEILTERFSKLEACASRSRPRDLSFLL
jgi:dTDP-4-amino-4,6-dideoxygalactose transaminase